MSRRSAEELAHSGAANRVPGMKRTIGPKRCAAAKPTKSSPGSVERNQRSSTGRPSCNSMPARISGARKGTRSRAKRKPAATMTSSASRVEPSVRTRRIPPSRRSIFVTATPSATWTSASAGRSHGEPPALSTRAVRRRRITAGREARRSGWQHEAIERRRPVADDWVSEAVEALPQRPAMLVGLAVGEPMKLRADEELHLRARTCREGGALESALTSPDHDDPARSIGGVVLQIGREPDDVADCLGQRRRRVCEGDSADGQCDRADIDLRAGRRRHAEPAARCSLDGGHRRRVRVWDEDLSKPGGVAKELLERDRLLPRLTCCQRPAVDGALAARRGERRLVPVRSEQHVGRHPGSPRLHRLAKDPSVSVTEVRGDGEAVGTRPDDGDVDALNHGRCPPAARGSRSAS